MDGVDWKVPGAYGGEDVAQTAICERTLLDPGYWYSFDVSDLVRGWVGDPGSNHGLLLRSVGMVRSGYRFYSSDNREASYRPKLHVLYTTIQPTATPTITSTPTPTATASPTLPPPTLPPPTVPPPTVPPPTVTPSPLPQVCLPLVLK